VFEANVADMNTQRAPDSAEPNQKNSIRLSTGIRYEYVMIQ